MSKGMRLAILCLSVMLLCTMTYAADREKAPFELFIDWLKQTSVYNTDDVVAYAKVEVACSKGRAPLGVCLSIGSPSNRTDVVKRVMARYKYRDRRAYIMDFDEFVRKYERCDTKVRTVSVAKGFSVLEIRLGSMCRTTARDIVTQIEDLAPTNDRIVAAVLRLDGNMGGNRNAAYEVGNLFLSKHDAERALASLRTVYSNEVSMHGVGMLKSLSLVGVVNGRTASSAEILIAYLDEQGRFTETIGKPTYGKTSYGYFHPVEHVGVVYVTAGYSSHLDGTVMAEEKYVPDRVLEQVPDNMERYYLRYITSGTAVAAAP